MPTTALPAMATHTEQPESFIRCNKGASLGNTLLIAAQCPDATCVAGNAAWRTAGRQVRKGERGIVILAPLIRR
jgi:hypothetical protein